GTPALSRNKEPKAQDSPKTSHNLSPGDTCFSHSSTDAYGLGVGCPGRDRQRTGMCDDEPQGRLVACHAQGSRRQGPTQNPNQTTKTKSRHMGGTLNNKKTHQTVCRYHIYSRSEMVRSNSSCSLSLHSTNTSRY